MSVTREYFKIQQTRFGERMQLDWRISSQCDPEDLLVPPFILETMVENAVKHGLEPKPQGGLVRVRIYMKEEILHLIVVDNGCGIPLKHWNTFIGEKNLRRQTTVLGFTM